MALDIWDLEDAPKPSQNRTFANDLVGHLRGGYQENGVPVASETVVMTTDDPTVAAALSEKFGGVVEELDVDRGDDHRLVSEATSVDLLVDSPDDLSARFSLYGTAGLIFATDGKMILEGEDFQGNGVGEEWTGRPPSLEAWKKAAQSGRAPRPDIRLKAKIADLPELGYFSYRTTGWSLVRDLPALEQQLSDAFEQSGGEPVRVTLTFRQVEIKKGPYAGRTYTRPVISVKG